MLIDWFTVGAQALNFLVLVWLLKRFLYQPILHALDAREKQIASELAEAGAKMAEAQKQRGEFERKNAEFDQQRAALWSKAGDEAKDERRRLVEEARAAADLLRARHLDTLRNDARSLNQALIKRTREEVFEIARKTLEDLAGASLETQVCEVFIRRLRAMDSQAKEVVAEALRTSSNPALVRTAFDLPAEQREAIQKALKETFPSEFGIRFETAPDLVSGIEFSANGQKLEWSIADYLASLEKGVGELLRQQAPPGTRTGASSAPISR